MCRAGEGGGGGGDNLYFSSRVGMRVEEGGDDSWCETHSTTASFGRELLTELLIIKNSQENIGSTASGSQIQYNSVKHLLPPCKAKEPHYYAVLFSSFVLSLSLSLSLSLLTLACQKGRKPPRPFLG